MPDLQDKHDDSIFFDPADEAIIFNAVAPETGEVSSQRSAKSSRIFGLSDPFAQVAQNGLLRARIEFTQIAASALVKFDSPYW